MSPKSFVWLEIIPWQLLALPVTQSLVHDEDFAVVSNWIGVGVKFFRLEARSLEERELLWLNVFVKFDACAHWLRKRGLPSLSIRITFSPSASNNNAGSFLQKSCIVDHFTSLYKRMFATTKRKSSTRALRYLSHYTSINQKRFRVISVWILKKKNVE